MSVLTNPHTYTHTYMNIANLQSKFSVNKAEQKNEQKNVQLSQI